MPLNVFVGYDAREHAAFEVACASIRRRSSTPVLTHPLSIDHLTWLLAPPTHKADGRIWCPDSNSHCATDFARSRFAVPFLQRRGWAVFLDADMLCRADIAELFALADDRFAVQVVKHFYVPGEAIKMDNQPQTFYHRKNWSSVILWNLNHPAHDRLTRERLNLWPGIRLHQFDWLADEEIGDLPPEWNVLVGVDGERRLREAKILHYTLGGPWLPECVGGPADLEWLDEARQTSNIQAV